MPELGLQDAVLAERFARSAASPGRGAAAALAWLAERAKGNHFNVRRIPFDQLNGWEFAPQTGNLGHRSGRFFTVEGMRVVVAGQPPREWHQPVVNQPESGVVGFIVKEIDDVLHFLVQAKMEPGNRNLLQLSPTVQATASNYDKVHEGEAVRYMDLVTRGDPARVLVDEFQSHPGSCFFRKTNRNMIVEATGDVPEHEDFRWLTLGEIGELLHHANVVNMDSRSVLGCAPMARPEESTRHTDADLLAWFRGIRAHRRVSATKIPLAGLPGWRRDEWSVSRVGGGPFSIVAVSAEAANREVTSWTQPLVEPHGLGVNAFLSRTFDGVLHVLVHANMEPGLADEVELGPTVQAAPEHDRERALFLDDVLDADPARVRFAAILSEEGGRFLNAENRYLVVDTDQVEEPPGYRWMTPAQLSALVERSHYVNVQARSLLACLIATGLG